jgi:hypothetical protein
MLSDERRIMGVRVVLVVVPMHVLVLDLLMFVTVAVTFANVQIHAERKQCRGGEREGCRISIAQ